MREMLRRATLLFAGTGAALAFACSSDPEISSPASAIQPEEEASTGEEAGTPPDASDPALRDAGAEADARQPPSAWKNEFSAVDFYAKTGTTTVEGLAADPTTPRRLLVRLGPGLSTYPTLAVVWNAGLWSTPLRWLGGGTPGFVSGGNGGGFASDGKVYDYIGRGSASPWGGLAQAVVGVFDDPSWTWPSFDPSGNWPPSEVHIMPGTPARAFLRKPGALIEIGGSNATFTLGGVGRISLSPDRATYLGISETGVVRCALTSAECTQLAATGILPGDDVREIFVAPTDAARVFLWAVASGSMIRRLYVSKDGGQSFTLVPLPPGLILERPVWSPAALDSLAVKVSGTSTSAPALYLTHDLGGTWTELAAPKTQVSSLQALVFDAIGTLFLAAGGELFSQAMP